MSAHPQQSKPFLPPRLAKATEVAALVGRTQCGKKGKRAKWLRAEQHIVRQQAKATYRHLVNFVCNGKLDCTCVGCDYDPPAAPKNGTYPSVACHGLHWGTHTIEAVLSHWFAEASSFDSFYGKVCASFPPSYPVSHLVNQVIDEILAGYEHDPA